MSIFSIRHLGVFSLIAGANLLAPLTASASPPANSGGFTVLKPLPNANAGGSSRVIPSTQNATQSQNSLYQRFRRVLVHPEPKRIINGRCVILTRTIILPPLRR